MYLVVFFRHSSWVELLKAIASKLDIKLCWTFKGRISHWWGLRAISRITGLISGQIWEPAMTRDGLTWSWLELMMLDISLQSRWVFSLSPSSLALVIKINHPEIHQVHRAVVLPLLPDVVSPLHLDSPTLLFPETSVSVLRAIVSLFYEGTVITSQEITSEVLTTMINLGLDPEKFSKVDLTECFVFILFKIYFSSSLFRSPSQSPSPWWISRT